MSKCVSLDPLQVPKSKKSTPEKNWQKPQGVVATPPPIFSLLLQNPSGHTGMLLELVVDMIPLQNDAKFDDGSDPGIQYGGWNADSSPENSRILIICHNLS